MSTALSEAQDYAQLVRNPESDSRYLYQHIFQDSGMGSKKRLKRKFKIVKGLDAFLGKILDPDEKVFFVSYGVINSFLEQMFMGWVMHLINRKAFIFTSRRLILVQLKSQEAIWDLKSVMRYPAIRKLRKTWNGQLKIDLHDGKSFGFVGVPKGDRKFIATTIQGLIERFSQEKSREGQIHLCPECGAKVDGFPPACGTCGKAFKNPAEAAWLSLLFPGLGDFYLGHRGIAVLEMLGALFGWFVCMSPDGENPATALEYVILAAFLIMHGMDALVTRHIARKGIYPA